MAKQENPNSPVEDFIRTIHRVAWRLRMIRFSKILLHSLFYCLSLAVLGIIIAKITPLPYSPQSSFWLVTGFGLASLPVTLILFFLSPIPIPEAALTADQQLHLKEKLSSALEIYAIETSGADETEREWREVLIREANRAAHSIHPSRNFPFRVGREGRFFWLPLVLGAAAMLFLPEVNWSTGKKAEAAVEEQENVARELKKLAEKRVLTERKDPEQESPKTEQITKEIEKLAREMGEGKIERREMMSKLASLADQMEQRRAALSRQEPGLKPLNLPLQAKFTEDLAKALMEGDFKAAASKLDELKKLAGQEQLSRMDLSRLGDELTALSASLDENSALSEALNAAAKSLKGLELSQSALSDQELANILEAMDLAGMSLDDLGDLAGQIAMLDQMMGGVCACRASLANATGWLCPCCGGMCGGMCAGLGNRPGAGGDGLGMGGPGRGRGNQAPFAETETGFQPDKLPGQFQKAPIVGSLLVKGLPRSGQASVEFSDVVLQSRQAAEDTFNRESVPLTYRSSVRRYFDALQTQNASEEEK
ncbi:MAG: hypothetical protein ABIH23_32695 [bacterium]